MTKFFWVFGAGPARGLQDSISSIFHQKHPFAKNLKSSGDVSKTWPADDAQVVQSALT
jgi:hypothetical protein